MVHGMHTSQNNCSINSANFWGAPRNNNDDDEDGDRYVSAYSSHKRNEDQSTSTNAHPDVTQGPAFFFLRELLNADLRRRLRCRPYAPWKSEGTPSPDRFLQS